MIFFKFRHLAIILFILLFSISCAKEKTDLLEDMAKLDKEYIKTLLIAKNMDGEKTKQSIEAFANYWNNFKKKYYEANKEDRQWELDFDSLKDILIRSHFYASNGEDVSASYLILHDIKYVLSDLRKRNNIDWFVDKLSAVYKTAYRMNELSKDYVLTNAKQKQIYPNPDEIRRLEAVYSLLDSASQKIKYNIDKSNIEYFNISDYSLNGVKQNIVTMDNIVADIGTQINAKNYQNIFKLTENIIDIYFHTLYIIVSDN